MKKKLLALILCLVLILGFSLSVSASYCSGSMTNQTIVISGTTYTWSGSYHVSSTKVAGSVSCGTAHDVSVYLHVHFKWNGQYYVENVGNTADPGTYAAKRWDAGSGRVIQNDSYTLLEIQGVSCFHSP